MAIRKGQGHNTWHFFKHDIFLIASDDIVEGPNIEQVFTDLGFSSAPFCSSSTFASFKIKKTLRHVLQRKNVASIVSTSDQTRRQRDQTALPTHKKPGRAMKYKQHSTHLSGTITGKQRTRNLKTFSKHLKMMLLYRWLAPPHYYQPLNSSLLPRISSHATFRKTLSHGR